MITTRPDATRASPRMAGGTMAPAMSGALVLLAMLLLLAATLPVTALAQAVGAESGGTPPASGIDTSAARSVATEADTTRNWYDSLEVRRPRYARATVGERLALSAFTALALPVGLTVGATTLVPPMLNFLTEGDMMHFGITAGVGFGFGGDTMLLVHYPDFRIQLDIGYYFERERPFIAHAAIAKDLWIRSIHAQDLVAIGAAAGAGVASDAHAYSPFVEGWVGLLNPIGIQFAPLFPMHNYGVRGRVGYDPVRERTWFEISLGITSTFGR